MSTVNVLKISQKAFKVIRLAYSLTWRDNFSSYHGRTSKTAIHRKTRNQIVELTLKDFGQQESKIARRKANETIFDRIRYVVQTA